jgi:hypothetical protein
MAFYPGISDPKVIRGISTALFPAKTHKNAVFDRRNSVFAVVSSLICPKELTFVVIAHLAWLKNRPDAR